MPLPFLVAIGAATAIKLMIGATAAGAAGVTIAAIAASDSDKNSNTLRLVEQERQKARCKQKEDERRQAREDIMRRLENLRVFTEQNNIGLQFNNMESCLDTKAPEEFRLALSSLIENALNVLIVNEKCGKETYSGVCDHFQQLSTLRLELSYLLNVTENQYQYQQRLRLRANDNSAVQHA